MKKNMQNAKRSQGVDSRVGLTPCVQIDPQFLPKFWLEYNYYGCRAINIEALDKSNLHLKVHSISSLINKYIHTPVNQREGGAGCDLGERIRVVPRVLERTESPKLTTSLTRLLRVPLRFASFCMCPC